MVNLDRYLEVASGDVTPMTALAGSVGQSNRETYHVDNMLQIPDDTALCDRSW